MGYSALNIAAEVITEYHEKGLPITNLALQKILYYIQIQHLDQYGCCAFDDDIEAWRHGPVVRSVYNTFRKYISSAIEVDDISVVRNTVQLTKEVKKTIHSIVGKAEKYSDAWILVDKTHHTLPWKNAYIPGESVIIPKSIMKNFGEVNI